MMISLIVVALVGIGFTRLTMLALELRDNFDEQYGSEQEVRSPHTPRARIRAQRTLSCVPTRPRDRSKSTSDGDESTRTSECDGSQSPRSSF